MKATTIKNILANGVKHLNWHGSGKYWEQRYKKGGNSGDGSYGKLSKFKAEVLNSFVENNDIQDVIEWGCGDGNQLKLMEYPKYIGYDISRTAVDKCKKLFEWDSTKTFECNADEGFANNKKADLALSLDVLYHLVEEDVYKKYMDDLFASSKKYVCIYSCNFNKNHDIHVKCRKFTDYVEKEFPEHVSL